MNSTLSTALRLTLITFVLTGLAYPLVLTAAARLLFPYRAGGSLVERDGVVLGSELLAQSFIDPGYFQPRPSAAGPGGYDAASSSGSNLGPASGKLGARVAADLQRLVAANPQADGPVPVELVTASGSGLDPHISPDGARWQAPRVARSRGLALTEVVALITAHLEPRTLGFLGEPRVNVLRLNLALDARFGLPRGSSPESHP